MALPVSAVAPSPAPRLFDPGSYRSKFDLAIPGFNKELSDLVCGTVVNTLALKATSNKLRTFTYNLMAKGGYNSEEFADLCTFAGNYSLLKYIKDKKLRENEEPDYKNELRNLRSTIAASTPDAITLWMSQLVYQYDGLEYEIGSDLFHKTKQNNGIYHNTLKEIQSMNLNQQQILALLSQQAGGQAPQNPQGLVNVNIGGQIVQLPLAQALQLKQMSEQSNMQQAMASMGMMQPQQQQLNPAMMAMLMQQQGQQQPQFVNGNTLAGITSQPAGQPQGLSQVNFGNPVPQGNHSLMNKWKKANGMEDTAEQVQVGDTFKEINLFGNIDVTDVPVKESTTQSHKSEKSDRYKKVDTEKLPVYGGSEAMYSTENIQIAGRPWCKQEKPIYMKLSGSIKELLRADPKDAVKTVSGPNEEGELVETEVEESVMFNKTPVLASSVSSFLNSAYERYCIQMANGGCEDSDIYAAYGMAIRPYFHNSEDSVAIIEAVLSRNSNILKLRSAIDSSITAINKGQSDDSLNIPFEAVNEGMRVISGFNTWITGLINGFMYNSLHNRATIDSFVTDFAELELYVAKVHGPEGTVALDEYMDTVLSSVREGQMRLIAPYVKEMEEATGLRITPFVENCGVIVLPYTSDELGIVINDDVKVIDRESNQVLTSACDTLFRLGEKVETTVLNAYLVFRDGFSVSVNHAPLKGPNTYSIRSFTGR